MFKKIDFLIGKKGNKKIHNEEQEEYKNSLVCRFVIDGKGTKVGESVAIDEDLVIIKSGNTYMGVPLKHVEEEGKTLLVKGIVDHDKAEEMGEKWLRETYNKTSKDMHIKNVEKKN